MRGVVVHHSRHRAGELWLDSPAGVFFITSAGGGPTPWRLHAYRPGDVTSAGRQLGRYATSAEAVAELGQLLELELGELLEIPKVSTL